MMKKIRIIWTICLMTLVLLFGWHMEGDAQIREPVRVGIRPYAPPYIYFEKIGDEVRYKGSTAEVLMLLEQILDTRFEYHSSDDVEQRIEWLKEGRIDVIAGTGKEIENNPDIRFIPSGRELKYRLFATEDCLSEDCYYDFSNKRIVLITGVKYPTFLDNIPQHQKLVVNTDHEALRMLNKELVDLFVAPSERVASYIIEEENYKNIFPVGEILGTVKLGYAVRTDDRYLHRRLSEAVSELVHSGTIAYLEDKRYMDAFEELRRNKKRARFFFIFSFFILIIIVGGVWSYLLRSRVRRITKELKASEERLINLIKFSPEMIFIIDSEGKIRQYNQSAALKFGAMLRQGIDQSLINFIVPGERDDFRAFLKSTVKEKEKIAEFHFTDEKHRIRDVEVVAMRLTPPDPEGPIIYCYARDMTKRNLLEKELIQADRLATIGQMAAAVAHEINNPLGIVQANVGLLMSSGIDDEEAKSAVQTISRNVDRAGKITQNLLDIAKPKPPEMKAVALMELVEQTLAIVKLQLKGVDIRHEKRSSPVKVNGDPGLLEQVFINLLLNAKTAMETVAVKRLRIHYETFISEGTVAVHVTDTGKGISQRQLEKIFDPFFTTNRRSGFGLGLFLSHRIIENHGGRLEASSQVNIGTEFVIMLPTIDA